MVRRALQSAPKQNRVNPPAELGEAARWRHIEDVDLWKSNPRRNDQAAEGVADLIILYGFGTPMMTWRDPDTGRDRIIAGNTRKKGVLVVLRRYADLVAQGGEANPEFERQNWHPQAKAIGRSGFVPVRERNDLSREEATELALADNKSNEWAQWDNGLLAGLMKNVDPERALKLGWDADALKRLLNPNEEDPAKVEQATTTLAQRFTVPPFSVLDGRQGYWKARKKAWIDLGLKSYLGREEMKAVYNTQHLAALRKGRPLTQEEELQVNLSIFDPVLAELAYRWFCPPAGAILDPFAGGSVRGLVAQRLGCKYLGIDLRPEQVQANKHQATKIGHRFANPQGMAEWVVGDASAVLAGAYTDGVDLVFSCPPYMDLEVYSDNVADLSAMKDVEFWRTYRDIIAKATARLHQHRFAVWVVGELRTKGGGPFKGFVPGTIKAFEDAGLRLYNEAVYLTSLNTVPLRAARHFTSGRKLERVHQTVLVFVKGDWKEASKACGDVANCIPDDLTQYVDNDGEA